MDCYLAFVGGVRWVLGCFRFSLKFRLFLGWVLFVRAIYSLYALYWWFSNLAFRGFV